MKEWPVLKPLPSYGRGRDAAGGRFTSLIYGTNLTDVIVTGLNYVHLHQSICSNLTLPNQWTLHELITIWFIRGQWYYRWSRFILVAKIPQGKVEIHPALPNRVYVLGYHSNFQSNPS